jgi:hypothetical protein
MLKNNKISLKNDVTFLFTKIYFRKSDVQYENYLAKILVILYEAPVIC